MYMSIDYWTGQPIHKKGFWAATQCLIKEQQTVDSIESALMRQGFDRADNNIRLWTRHNKKVVLCLVDDVRSAGRDYETDTPYLFDRDTLVITDNYFPCPVTFEVAALPVSFFSIYCSTNSARWRPDRAFSFSINRIDQRRSKLMLELAKRVHLPQGYINFNCQTSSEARRRLTDPQPTIESLRDNFSFFFDQLSPEEKEKYQTCYRMLEGIMPYRNYDDDHEDIHLKSLCNIVVESYGSDTTVAFSEKIFRALQLPVPWTVYGGHYAVAYLESLGFDCMSDVVNHNHYDQLKEIEDKAHVFVWFALKCTREIGSMDQPWLVSRCQRAARHNQELLSGYQKRWMIDLHEWIRHLEQRLAK